MPAIRRKLEGAENVIFESNSILKFLTPDLYLTVLDPATKDFKKSAQEFLDRADAVVLHAADKFEWEGISLKPVQGRPVFRITPPEYVTPEIVEFVMGTQRREKLKLAWFRMFGVATKVYLACMVVGISSTSNRSAHETVVPWPTVLSAQMRPFISVASCLQIARPKPVPPYLRAVETCACVKLSKIDSSLSGGMPIPVSVTEKSRAPGSEISGFGATRNSMEPCSVNLMALPTRLTRICWRRVGSP